MWHFNYSRSKVMRSISCVLVLLALPLHASDLPPDPDNAALFYYQAFLLCPEHDYATENLIRHVLKGREPDGQIKEYLRRCNSAIEYAMAGTQVERCQWGTWYSEKFNSRAPYVLEAEFLASVLGADAITLATDRDYQVAFARCLAMRRLAGHIGCENSVSPTTAMHVETLAQRCICEILGSLAANAETVTRLISQLAATPPMSPSPAETLQMDLEVALETVRRDEQRMLPLRSRLVETDERGQNVSDDELLARIREPYTEFLNSALGVMNAGVSYERTCAEIHELENQLERRIDTSPVVSLARGWLLNLADGAFGFYNSQVQYTARLSAFRAALQVYLKRAESGHLPKTLPSGVPKDPYSGRDFEYRVTDDGFVLRARAEDMRHEETKEYHFKVRVGNGASTGRL